MSTEPQVAILAQDPATQRPALRGTLHLAAAFAAVAGTVWLQLIADSPTAYVGAAIFGASLILLYSTSAGYHTIPWSATLRNIVRRVDQSMIFVLIAGTYTPFCLKVSLEWGIPLLVVVWTLAGAGVLLKSVWPGGPRWLTVGLYLGLGWVGIAVVSEALAVFPVVSLVMLAIGGVLYSVGAIVYGLRRPDPWPRVFGFHEVFHGLVVAGSAVHFSLIAVYILPA